VYIGESGVSKLQPLHVGCRRIGFFDVTCLSPSVRERKRLIAGLGGVCINDFWRYSPPIAKAVPVGEVAEHEGGAG
jgi:hypothetical protein